MKKKFVVRSLVCMVLFLLLYFLHGSVWLALVFTVGLAELVELVMWMGEEEPKADCLWADVIGACMGIMLLFIGYVITFISIRLW